MRIISGELRGRRIYSLPNKNTRPTTGSVREAVFNILSNFQISNNDIDAGEDRGNIIDNCNCFLDVCSGTGAIGFEALSRGAKKVIFIEQDAEMIDDINVNIEKFAVSDKTRVIKANATNVIKASEIADIIYIDPPYETDNVTINKIVVSLKEGGWIDKKSLIILEVDKRSKIDIPSQFNILKDREYGKTRVLFLLTS